MVTLQIPDNPNRPEVVLAPQMQNLLDNLVRCPVGVVSGDWLGIAETVFTVLAIGLSPSIEAGAPDPEISTGDGHAADLVSVVKNTEFATYLALILVHGKHPPSRRSRLTDVSRKVVHIYTQ